MRRAQFKEINNKHEANIMDAKATGLTLTADD